MTCRDHVKVMQRLAVVETKLLLLPFVGAVLGGVLGAVLATLLGV